MNTSEISTHDRLLTAAIAHATGSVIVAIDPGATCGIAWLDREGQIHTDHISSAELKAWLVEMVHWEISEDTCGSDWNDHQWIGTDRYCHQSELPMPDLLVVESWRLYKMNASAFTNSDMPEPRLIGRIEMAADLIDIPIHFQGASMMKTVPWVEIGEGPHEQDAAKHLVRYLIDRASDTGRVGV